MEAPQETLAEQIAARLRRSILRGTLPPGAPIKERDSAATMGVSRTPMREAIRILAKEGLVVLPAARCWGGRWRDASRHTEHELIVGWLALGRARVPARGPRAAPMVRCFRGGRF